ncbi:MAG: 3-isopropylmalate dehydrogenase [Christensenellales bacterium]
MSTFNIAVIQGDGIGPEVTDSAMAVLTKIGERYNHTFNFTPSICGGCAYDKYGEPLPKESLDICLNSDSVLLGAVGGPQYDSLPYELRPERALLGVRKAMGLYANLRPAKMFPALSKVCPLKNPKDIDLLVVRELIGGIYFGEKGIRNGKLGREGYDVMAYSEMEVERIGRIAFELAQKRRGKVSSVDKANVLSTSGIWRKIIHDIHEDYPDVTLEDVLVDNMAMQLVREPSQFDVIVTGNLFGDILSDLASQCVGSIGILPSASLGDTTRGLYEPIHGSAPTIAGKNIANPIATILSAAMMLRYSFDLQQEGEAIEKAVEKTLNDGARTADLQEEGLPVLGTREITEVIIKNI